MSNNSILQKYTEQLEKLKKIVIETNSNIVSEDPSPYFEKNVNFFTKSFLVNLCAYLESFIKDITFYHIEKINQKIISAKIPHNLILWDINYDKEIKDKSFVFKNLKIKIKKKDLDSHISGSPYRTLKLFRNIGIDLDSISAFNNHKENVNMIIVKRNKILHHNDEASDISLNDVTDYISEIVNYMEVLSESIDNSE